MKKILVLLTIIIAIAVAVPISMEKDIQVMESILDKIIVEDSPIYFSFGNTFEGEYYDDYGIILSCESSGVMALDEIIEVKVDKVPYFIDTDNEEERIIVKKRDKEIKKNVDEKQESIDQKLKETKTVMEDFMLNYARGAMKLKDNEKVLINIKFNPTIRVEKELKTPLYLQMTANVANLKKYYSGKWSESKMRKALIYEAPFEAPEYKDVEVMEDIFDTFLEKDNDFIHLDNATKGTYLDGFGAVFNIPVNSGRGILPSSINFDILEKKLADGAKQIEIHAKKLEEKFAKMDLYSKSKNDTMDNDDKVVNKKVIKKEYKWKQKSDDEDSHFYVYKNDDDTAFVTLDGDSIDMDIDVTIDVDEDGARNVFIFGDHFKVDEAEVDSLMNATKNEVLKTLSIYGSTLKSVKNNEKVVVNIEYNGHDHKRKINLVCSKMNIIDYTNGKVDYKKFLENIKIR